MLTFPSSPVLRVVFVLTLLILLLGPFAWLSYIGRRVLAKVTLAAELIVLLIVLAALTDWPWGTFRTNTFWQDHALVAGVIVSILLLPSLYLFIDVNLKLAKDERDKAFIDEIKKGIQRDHLQFWVWGTDLAPTSALRAVALETVRDAKEAALTAQAKIAVWAQLSMSLESVEGMTIAQHAIRTFGALGTYISALEAARGPLLREKRLPSLEATQLANEALDTAYAAHTIAHESHVKLLRAAGDRSQLAELLEAETSD